MKTRMASLVGLLALLCPVLASGPWAAGAEESGPEPGARAMEEGIEPEPEPETLVTLEIPLLSPLFASTPVAVVDDEPITFQDLMGGLASSHAGRATARTAARRDLAALLDRILTTRLIVAEARAIGLDEIPDIADRIDAFARDLLVQNLMDRQLRGVEPDPAEVERLYQRMAREFLLSTLQFKKEEDALAFREEYARSADFEDVAMRFFEAGRATGELGSERWVKLKDLVPSVAQVADQLEAGSLSGIFRAPPGYLVFLVRDVRSYDDADLREEASRRVGQPLLRARAREYSEELVEKYSTIDFRLLEEVSFEPRRTGLPFFRKEQPVDFEKLARDERVVATVHDEEPITITVGQLAQRVEEGFFHGVEKAKMERGELNRRKGVTLHNMVFQKAAPLEARRLGLDREPEYVDTVRERTNGILFDAFVRRVIVPDVTITEEEAKRYYTDHLEDFSSPKMLRLRGLAFDTLADAESARDKLAKKADFQWVSANSRGQVDRDKERVLDFDDVLVSVSSLPEGLRHGADGAREGDALLYSAPDNNHYVVVVARIFPPAPKPYEEARREIAKSISEEKVKDLVDEWGAKLREAYEPRIFLQGLQDRQ